MTDTFNYIDYNPNNIWWASILNWWMNDCANFYYTYINIYYSLTILINVRVYATVIFWQTPRAIYHFFGRIFAKVTTIVRIAPMTHNSQDWIFTCPKIQIDDNLWSNSAVNAGGNKLTTAHVIEHVNIPLVDIE